jgi:hypothetical protein
MFSRSVSALALLAAKAAATIYYAGVAESGGEFGVYSMLNATQVFELELLTSERRCGHSWDRASRTLRGRLCVYQ